VEEEVDAGEDDRHLRELHTRGGNQLGDDVHLLRCHARASG
jgi:hypothetical protein